MKIYFVQEKEKSMEKIAYEDNGRNKNLMESQQKINGKKFVWQKFYQINIERYC
jgi:hypothetical protein